MEYALHCRCAMSFTQIWLYCGTIESVCRVSIILEYACHSICVVKSIQKMFAWGECTMAYTPEQCVIHCNVGVL